MMCNLLILMVPIIGVEPTTFALRNQKASIFPHIYTSL